MVIGNPPTDAPRRLLMPGMRGMKNGLVPHGPFQPQNECDFEPAVGDLDDLTPLEKSNQQQKSIQPMDEKVWREGRTGRNH